MISVTNRVDQMVRRVGYHKRREPWRQSGGKSNALKRAALMFIGSMLTIRGFRNGSLWGILLVLAGGGLIIRGLGGHIASFQRFYRAIKHRRASVMAELPGEELRITSAITIKKPADELYRMWRDPEIKSKIMAESADVTIKSAGQAHWVLYGPTGGRTEWDSEIVEDHVNEFLRWRSLPDATLPNEGSIKFRPRPSGIETEVFLEFRFIPSENALAGIVLNLADLIPKLMAYKALWRFKTFAETGTIPSRKTQLAG